MMRTSLALIAVLVTTLGAFAGPPGDVTGDGVTDSEDLTCVNATIFDEDAGCAVETVSYVRTIVVSPVPGDSLASGDALIEAVDNISGASQTNPYLVKLEPGVYNLGGGRLITQEWVDIEGAGEDVTWITSAGASLATVQLTTNCEIRLLTIAHNGGSLLAVALETLEGDAGSRRTLRHVRIQAFSGSSDSTGIWAEHSITMKDCSITVTGPDSALGAHLEARSSLQHVTIYVYEAPTCMGLDITGAYGSILRSMDITVKSGTDCTGIRQRDNAYSEIYGSKILAQICSSTNTAIENDDTIHLHIQDTFAVAGVGTVGSGIGLKNTGGVDVEVLHSTIGADGFSGPLRAVENSAATGGPYQVMINDSVLIHSVLNDDEYSIGFGSCQFRWGSFSGGGTIRCIGCYDEDYQNGAGWTSCPP